MMSPARSYIVRAHSFTRHRYACIKAAGPLSTLYFISLIAFGAFYVLNLFLAVLWETYCDSLMAEQSMLDADAAMAIAADSAQLQAVASSPTAKVECASEVRAEGGNGTALASSRGGTNHNCGCESNAGKDDAGNVHLMTAYDLTSDGFAPDCADGGGGPRRESAFTRACLRLTNSGPFQNVIIGLIVLNTFAMALERYPMDALLEARLEALNVWLYEAPIEVL